MSKLSQKKFFPHKGLTLIEFLIYIFIFGFLMVIITSLAISFTEANAKSKIKKEVFIDTFSAMKTIMYEIKRANDIYLLTSVFDTSPGQLSIETSYGIPFDEKIGYIDFYIDNGRLYLKRDGQDIRAVTSENMRVSNFIVEHLSSFPDSIKISLSLEYFPSTSKYSYSYSLSSVANLRK